MLRKTPILQNNVLAILKRKGWSQSRLARAVGLDRDTINKLIHRTRDPRVSTALKISAALGCKTEDIWHF